MLIQEEMNQEALGRFTPVHSLQGFWKLVVAGRLSSMPWYLSRQIICADGESFTVFKTLYVKGETLGCESAVFMVRFRPRWITIETSHLYSLAPVPFFVGLPGFRAKCWLKNSATGYCAGIYQWNSVEAASAYAQSFAMRYMTQVSDHGSVTWRIYSAMTIEDFLRGKISQ